MRIDWQKFWEDFDAWAKSKEAKCKGCGRTHNFPEWEDQQKWIQRRVNKETRRQ